ncbi:MAG: hypothetical protein KA257_12130 [Opitutaceae bacterium]|nr:hypothetical protein [Opitutaceae bacterium]
MGFFDRLAGKKTTTPVVAATNEAIPSAAGGNVLPRLIAAREKLEARELPAALVIYEEVLAAAGDRADVLVTISADLGINGHTREIVDLVAPRYDAARHGPATGLNLLQAYLALRNAEAAQHVLDILFDLQRPELEDRLHGFSNAIAELMIAGQVPPNGAPPSPEAATAEPPKVNLITISKPIWSYGLEGLPGVLPPKDGRLRRIAFVQLALPGVPELEALAQQPEENLGRLSRALPLWFAELFYFSPHYAPVAIAAVLSRPANDNHYALLPAEWTTDHLRQIVESTEGGLDYIFTGALRQQAGDYELTLRVWEVKKFRERKQFTVRWAPATADEELLKLQAALQAFMEWSPYPAGAGLAFAPTVRPANWLEVLGTSLTLFLGEKKILPAAQLAGAPAALEEVALHAACSEPASLAWFSARARARRLGVFPAQLGEALVYRTPLVEQARETTGVV